MLIELIRRAAGYVRFGMTGRSTEDFLNEVSASGIPLWEVTGDRSHCTACVAAGAYRSLHVLARGNGIRLKIEQKCGLPFRILQMRRRPGVPIGIVLFFLMQVFLSGFVWQVEISGTSALSPDQILYTAASLGARPGVRMSEMDTEQTCMGLLRQLPALSWAAVNRIGCRLEIVVRERGAIPKMIPVDEPCNIKARADGVIVRVQAEDGFSVVKPGDVVKAGDLLVEGMRQDALGATVLHHAHGSVLAVTSHTYQSIQLLTRTEPRSTGNSITRKRLAVFGAELPLTWTQAPQDGAHYSRSFSASPVLLFGLRLPMQIYTEVWTEQTDVQVSYTEEQAREQGLAAVQAQLKAELGERALISREETCVTHSGAVIVSVTVTCEEDIGYQEAIYLAEPSESAQRDSEVTKK